MWMLGWGSDNGDPDNYLGWHFAILSASRGSRTAMPTIAAELLIEGRIEATPPCAKIHQEAEQLIHDDVARISVVWASTPWCCAATCATTRRWCSALGMTMCGSMNRQ